MLDVGLAALEKIHKQLLIDEPWTVRGDREFSWIGHRLRQNVRASKQFDDDGISLSRLAASCVVVEGVTKPDRDVLRILSWVNRHAVGSVYTGNCLETGWRLTAIVTCYAGWLCSAP